MLKLSLIHPILEGITLPKKTPWHCVLDFCKIEVATKNSRIVLGVLLGTPPTSMLRIVIMNNA